LSLFDWIEVYDGPHIYSAPCRSMPAYTEELVQAGGATWFADSDALLTHLPNVAYGRHVLVTMGDSNTAPRMAWPRHAAQTAERFVVVNIAHWAEYAAQHLPRLDALLALPGLRAAAASVSAVYFGGLIDCGDRWVYYRRFVDGVAADALCEGERDTARRPEGRRLARLLADPPADEIEAERWVARRALASVRVLADRALAADVAFGAILQPLCYDDLAPTYQAMLRAVHMQQEPQTDFTTWRHARPKKFALDFDDYYSVRARPALEQLRTIWPTGSVPGKALFLDWAAFFQSTTEFCYQGQFDACHYNGGASAALGAAVAGVMRRA
jgi:hypothetical protein